MHQNILPNSYLTLHYRVTLASGEGAGQVIIDTFTGKPATLELGQGLWSPYMELPLIGRQEGDELSYVLSGEEAYGSRKDELVQKISRSLVEQNAVLSGAPTTCSSKKVMQDPRFNPPGMPSEPFKVGDMIELTLSEGHKCSGTLRAWGDDWALIDFNHPLAGVDLKVDVKIIGVM